MRIFLFVLATMSFLAHADNDSFRVDNASTIATSGKNAGILFLDSDTSDGDRTFLGLRCKEGNLEIRQAFYMPGTGFTAPQGLGFTSSALKFADVPVKAMVVFETQAACQARLQEIQTQVQDGKHVLTLQPAYLQVGDIGGN